MGAAMQSQSEVVSPIESGECVCVVSSADVHARRRLQSKLQMADL